MCVTHTIIAKIILFCYVHTIIYRNLTIIDFKTAIISVIIYIMVSIEGNFILFANDTILCTYTRITILDNNNMYMVSKY